MKKYKIENNQIVEEVVLKTISDAENYPYSEGWRDSEIPANVSWSIQQLGEIYFDNVLDKVTWTVIDKELPSLENLKQKHYQDLDTVKEEITNILKDLNNKYNPMGLTSSRIPALLQNFLIENHPEDLNNRAITEIESLSTQEEAMSYVIKGVEIQGYINYLKSFL